MPTSTRFPRFLLLLQLSQRLLRWLLLVMLLVAVAAGRLLAILLGTVRARAGISRLGSKAVLVDFESTTFASQPTQSTSSSHGLLHAQVAHGTTMLLSRALTLARAVLVIAVQTDQ